MLLLWRSRLMPGTTTGTGPGLYVTGLLYILSVAADLEAHRMCG
jgi:hypothetical protein